MCFKSGKQEIDEEMLVFRIELLKEIISTIIRLCPQFLNKRILPQDMRTFIANNNEWKKNSLGRPFIIIDKSVNTISYRR